MSENNTTPVQQEEPAPVHSGVVTDEKALPLIPENKKFCHKCGAEVNHTIRYCQSCGAEVNTPMGATSPPVIDAEAQDAKDNKVMASLSYFGVLALVPLFAAKESPFARFHCNQGLILLIANVALTILKQVNASLIYQISSMLYGIINFAFSGIGIVIWVFALIGLIAAIKGEKKELPLIGNLKILK